MHLQMDYYKLINILFLLIGFYCFNASQVMGQQTESIEIEEELKNGTEISRVKEIINRRERQESQQSQSKTRQLFTNDLLSKNLRFNPQTARLYVNGRIDRDTLCKNSNFQSSDYVNHFPSPCIIEIQIRSNAIIIKIKIHIKDINDNTPTWGEKIMKREISEDHAENSIHSKTITLDRATDKDSGENGRISYLLQTLPAVNTQQYLSPKLDWSEGFLKLILSNSIDRETTPNLTMILKAIDHGNPRRTGSVTLVVIVKDKNDNAPKFEKTFYRTNTPLNETTAVGSIVLTVKATDPDEGVHGHVRYKMSDESMAASKEYFKVRPDGKIVVKARLDYDKERIDTFKMKVVAEDSAITSYKKSATADVEIKINDVNDEKPVILIHFSDTDKNKKPFIPENKPKHVVAFVFVSDKDYDGQDIVTCKIDDNKNFSLSVYEHNSYKLRSVTSFNREKQKFQVVSITCHDKANNRHTVTKRIDIGDVNDETPVFISNPFQFSILEHKPPGTYVGTIEATDKDLGNNSKIEYRMMPDYKNNFTVNSTTGKITSNVEFDRETKSSYTILVLAVDHGKPRLTGTGTIKLTIRDINDNVPTFLGANYHFKALENVSVNTQIGKVKVIDRDLNRNSKITLRILQMEMKKVFKIVDNSKIVTRRRLDRERVNQYILTLVATDSGRPTAKYASSTVTISVLDVNDETPRFTQPTKLLFELNTEAAVGERITTAKAIDDDEISEMHYYIVRGEPDAHFFSVDESTGVVFLLKSIRNRNTKQIVTLKLKACDGPEKAQPPPRCTKSETLRISLTSSPSGQPTTKVERPLVGGHEPIVICLAVIFAILVIATIVLIFLIRRKTLWIKKSKKPVISQPNPPDALQRMDGQKTEGPLFEGETLLAKQNVNIGSRDDLETIARRKQFYASHVGLGTLRRDEINMRPHSPDNYQTLDSLCQSYYDSGNITPGQARFLRSDHHPGFIYNPGGLQQQHQLQQLQQHTYYEIGNIDGPPTMTTSISGGSGAHIGSASANLGRRRSQTLQRPRPACDLGKHVFRPIATVTGESDESEAGNYRFEPSFRTLDRSNSSKGKYTYDAYKEASFV